MTATMATKRTTRGLAPPHLELLPGVDGMADGPLLVHIQHDAGVWAEDFAGQQRAANIALRVGRPHLLNSMARLSRSGSGVSACKEADPAPTDLELHGFKAPRHGALCIFLQLLVGELKPAKGRVIAGVAVVGGRERMRKADEILAGKMWLAK